MKRIHSTFLGAAAAALVLTTTTALAGSGVGGVFNLGQGNTVDAQTSLTGNPGSSPELKVTSTGTAAAVRGVATNGIGTNGISTSGVGQQGLSDSGTGTLGTHGNTTGISPGVEGDTNSTDPSGAGVVGRNNGGGPGLKAIVNAGAPPLAVNSSARVVNLNADLLDGLDSTGLPYWKLGGNAGTTPSTNFLGTTDNQPLELKVNGVRALRLEPVFNGGNALPNLIGGSPTNVVKDGAYGVTIAGGGTPSDPNIAYDNLTTIGGGQGNHAGASDGNRITSLYATIAGGLDNTATGVQSTIGGGIDNTASSDWAEVGGGTGNSASSLGASVLGGYSNTASAAFATVAGGSSNVASGGNSFAAGQFAQATDNNSFVWGDGSGNTLGSNGPGTVSFGATGGARFVTAFDSGGLPSSGVALASGGGSWSSLSDRAAKRNLLPVDSAQLLAKLAHIPISSWSYKAQQPSIRHLGPMAQDFRSAFGLGEDARHIDTIDSEGVALAAIQGLYRQNRALERQNRALSARLTRLEQLVAGLKR